MYEIFRIHALFYNIVDNRTFRVILVLNQVHPTQVGLWAADQLFCRILLKIEEEKWEILNLVWAAG
jgi:hypothetical protein